MSRKAKYAVKFVGYSASVIAAKYGRELEYATLDFVSGAFFMHADGGSVIVPKRVDAEPFLKSLPKLANELEDRLRQRDSELSQKTDGLLKPTDATGGWIDLSYGPNTVSVAPGTEMNRFIRQANKRFAEIERVVAQAEEIGLRIKRRPYSEYIDEIAKTGIAQVEGHGFGLFVDGRLIFYPHYQVMFIREVAENTFEAHSLDATSKIRSLN